MNHSPELLFDQGVSPKISPVAVVCLTLLTALLALIPLKTAEAARIPDELQPLSTDIYTFHEVFHIAPEGAAEIAIHSNGGLVDLEIRLLRADSGERPAGSSSGRVDTLRIYESTEISPRETIDVWAVEEPGFALYPGLRIEPGSHYFGIQPAPGSSGGIYEVRLSCRLDGSIINLKTGGGNTGESVIPIRALSGSHAIVEWFGRATIPELVGRKDFEGSFATADRKAWARGGWGLVLPEVLSAELPRFRDTRGEPVDFITSPDRITDEELRLSMVWLAGDPESNPWLKEALLRLGTQVTAGGFQFADGRSSGPGVLDCVIANPWAPDLPMRITVAPTSDQIAASRGVDSYDPGRDGTALDPDRHHTAITGASSLLFLDGGETLEFKENEPLFQIRAFDEDQEEYSGVYGRPDIWSNRFEISAREPVLSLENLSSRWDLRLEHFYIIWDGPVVEMVPPRTALTLRQIQTSQPPPWNDEYTVCVTVAQSTGEFDPGLVKIRATPQEVEGDHWVPSGEPVIGGPDQEGHYCVQFVRDGKQTAWSTRFLNESHDDTLFVRDQWTRGTKPTLRYIPWALGKTAEYGKQNAGPVAAGSGLLAIGIVAVVLLARRNSEKATILADIKTELNKARDIQHSLFPAGTLRESSVEVAGICRSMQEVGGDYYDFFTLPDGTTLMTIADVAGHGYAAALRMSGIHYHLHSGDFERTKPGVILTAINRNLAAAGRPAEFVTHFLACISPDRRTLRYANAGHPRALLIRDDGTVGRLDSTGMPLGIMPEAAYEEVALSLRAGDLLVAFTDGLLETTNHADEEFGEDRVVDVLSENSGAKLDSIFHTLFRSASGFSGHAGQMDDIAIIAARIGLMDAERMGQLKAG